MRDYAKVAPRFWIGDTGKEIRRLGLEARVVATYLLTAPGSNMLGLYYLPLPVLAHETGIPLEGASKALQSLIDAEFCAFDAPSEVVWVVNMAREQVGEELKPGDRQCVGIQKQYDSLPPNPFLPAFFDKYAKAYHMSARRDFAPKRRPSEAPSKPLRSQETEQEQEKDQERETETEQEREIFVPLAPARSVDPRADEIRAVFEHYRNYHPQAHKKPNAKLKEWSAIKARFDEGSTVEDLKLAIDGMQRTPWNQGENPSNAKYDKLLLVMRDGGQVSRFIENAVRDAQGPAPVLSEREMRGRRASEAFMALTDPNRNRQQPIEAEVIS